MAKGRKTKKGRKTRRRVGAFNANSPLVKLGSIAAGYLLANKINPAIDKVTAGKVNDKIVAAGQVGLGALLLLSKGKGGLIKTVAGGVAAGSGLKRLMSAMGVGPAAAVTGYGMVPVIGGYQNVPVIGRRMNGYRAGSSLSGYTPSFPINGVMGSVDGGLSNDGSGYMQ